jgi:hypothetical protein
MLLNQIMVHILGQFGRSSGESEASEATGTRVFQSSFSIWCRLSASFLFHRVVTKGFFALSALRLCNSRASLSFPFAWYAVGLAGRCLMMESIVEFS